MRPTKWSCMAIALACLSGVWLTIRQSHLSAQTKERPIVMVDDIIAGTVVGRLGIELGHVCTVEGTIFPDRSKAKLREGRLIFQVETVNQKRLEHPVIFTDDGVSYEGFDVRKHPQQSELVDRRLKLAVYESGVFSGLPTGDIYSPPIAGVGFGFHSQLKVVRDLSKWVNQKKPTLQDVIKPVTK